MAMMDDRFTKPYDPNETEERIYELWEQSGFFNPDICITEGVTEQNADPFSIVLPPPNVTGTLHTGHAMMLAVEDIMVRFHRMRGDKTLWVPGTDHAAIATESKVAKLLSKKGINRHELGREKFLEKVEVFAQDSHDIIVSQIKKMGASLDWSREAYTLDETRQYAVNTAFKHMYDDGLIYRAHRVVNWDPKGQTTISDDEIVYEEREATLYTFRYSKDFPISISTTRPETKLGDTAVAVHPDDERYKTFVGQTFENIPFAGATLSIRIIADEAVDPTFGTGAVGVTPAHSHTDADIASRHNVPSIQIIDEYGKMTAGNEGIKGEKTAAARETVVSWLKDAGLLENEETGAQNIATAERTGAIIEPLPKLQWFIDVNKKMNGKSLKERMLDAVKSGQTEILPERFEKIYFNWVENLRDWNISRQIWFGHRVPVWYRDNEIYCDVTPPKEDGWEQDTDTLDTWFSSGLWTFSTLGWPEETEDLKTYHPTSVLETGYDIIFFWVARMILMSTYLLDEVPFRTVYLHGLVRDEKGKKMSKSLGNIVDPVDEIEKYGADALRMALVVGVGPGNDSNLSEDKIRAYKKFANKLWNIARFVLESTEDMPTKKPSLTDSDRDRLEELARFIDKVTTDIEAYNFHLAAERIYHYVWHEVADNVLEESKPILNGDDEAAKASRQYTLHTILSTCLKMLHPFMPFITEAIWQYGFKKDTLLMIEHWPTSTGTAAADEPAE